MLLFKWFNINNTKKGVHTDNPMAVCFSILNFI